MIFVSVWKRSGLWGLVLMGVVGALLVPGCRNSGGNEDVKVRLINAVPEPGGLNVSVDGQRVWKRSQFRSSTGYQTISSGTYPLRVDAADLGATLLVQPLTFGKDREYTVLALGQIHGGGKPAEVRVLEDVPADQPAAGKVSVRLVNAALDVGAIDLVVNNIDAIPAVGYGRRSEALTLDAGPYDLKIAATTAPDTLTDPVHLVLEPGRTYTLIAMGRADSPSLSLEAYPDR